jgi:transposase-like protein
MSAKNINAAKGRRYTAKEKQEIIDYVDQVNAERGRGGQSAASKKFNLSQLTISSWIRKGVGSGNGVSAHGPAVSSGSIGKKLSKLQQLHDAITKAEKELARLRNEFNSIKTSI